MGLYVRLYNLLVVMAKGSEDYRRVWILVKCLRSMMVLPKFLCREKMFGRKRFSRKAAELVWKYLPERMTLKSGEALERLNARYSQLLRKTLSK